MAEKLGHEYGFEVKHYSEIVAEQIRAGEFAFPPAKDDKKHLDVVTWHDSCHIGRA